MGTFFNVITKSCEGCSIGMYQPREGQDKCVWCPSNTSTPTNSSKFVTQCKGVVAFTQINRAHEG